MVRLVRLDKGGDRSLSGMDGPVIWQAIGVTHDTVQDRLHPRWMKVVGSGRRHGC